MQKPDTAAQVHADHRDFIGGNGGFWDEVGTLTFDFIKSQGLKPSDRVLDVACGSLRSGQRLIDYLDADHYAGIDKHIELIIYGVAAELGVDKFREKRPQFIVSGDFDLSALRTTPTFALAQSLFTHLTPDDIKRCLMKVRDVAAPNCKFYVTFFEGDSSDRNPSASHSHDAFFYTREEMEAYGAVGGWNACYIGDWKHPRQQKMMCFTPALG